MFFKVTLEKGDSSVIRYFQNIRINNETADEYWVATDEESDSWHQIWQRKQDQENGSGEFCQI